MESPRPLHIVAVGGTFDKVYSLSGSLEIGAPAAHWLLAQGRAEIADGITAVVAKDSLLMTDADRAEIAEALRALPDNAGAVITHGTDTMAETARYLADRGELPASQTVVLTGAIEPAAMRDSDALFNLGSALSSAQLLPPGVYVNMNGRVFPADEVVKDRLTGRFVRRRDADTTEAPRLVDRSGTLYELADPRWRGDDGSPLAVTPLPGITKEHIDTGERSLWRYRHALPVDPDQRVSLGEGFTPLVKKDWSGHTVHFKLEWFNPTSSFKDRGVSVMISHLRANDAGRVLEDSSGNGGSAVAAYAAAAGIPAKIIVPATTSEAKILQARAFGAEIEKVPGTRDEVAAEAVRQSEDIPYASHNWHPMFLQGTKTLAYELWEMLGFRAPDNVVLVAGAGSQILGCDLAFTELLAAGQIEHRPRLLVGQPEHWATIVDTLNGADPGSRGERRPTIAEGASIARPVRLPETVEAIRRSDGAGYAVPEHEITAATRRLAALGLYAEPTSAVAAAALDHFIAEGTIQPGQTTVVVLSGSGLKSAEKMAAIFNGGTDAPAGTPLANTSATSTTTAQERRS